MKRLALLILLLASPAPAAMSEKAETAAICDAAALRGAETGDAPADILRALTRTETGRKLEGKLRPWPWTVNMEGAGHWFDTLSEARAFVVREYQRGARSFDVGCFQINYKWHKEGFSSIDEMFDPLANALYAARFLRELYAETGSWNAAAGAYHSRTREYADRYAARFAELRRRYLAEDAGQAPIQPGDAIPDIPDIVLAANGGGLEVGPPRVNTYPLLQRSGDVRPPLGGAPGASLFASAVQRVEAQ